MSSAMEWKAKGNAALSAKNYKEAIDCYTEAIALEENHVFFSNRSAAYLADGQAEKALEDAESTIRVKGDWPKGYGRKGAALHALARHGDSVAAYESGLKVDPDNAALKSGLEDVKQEMNAPPGGSPFPTNPFGPDMFEKIAGDPRVAHHLADPEFVSKLKELQSDPNKLNAHLQDQRVMEVLGFLLGIPMQTREPFAPDPSESTKKPAAPPKPPTPPPTPLTEEEKEALAKKEEADKIKAEGTAHYKKREFEEALKCYRAAEEVNPDPGNIVYRLNQAAVFFEMGDLEQSKQTCVEALEVGRANRAPFALVAKAYARIGNAEAKMGNLDAAIEAYQSSLVESNSRDVEKRLKKARVDKKKMEEEAYLSPELGLKAKEEGNEAFKAGDFPKAIKLYDEAIKRDPTVAAYWCNRGAAFTKLMRFDEAGKDVDHALELQPDYTKAWSRKGALLFLRKEFHKAMEAYQAGLKTDPSSEECKDGLARTIAKINELSRGGGAPDEERAARAMADPEIQAILRDPMVQQVLKDMQEGNSQAARAAMNDPMMSGKLSKLVAAGVLRLG